jgi:benzoyl-CoA reductase subunit BamC
MCESVPPLEKPMCVDACTFGALTYEEREEARAEEEKPGEMETVFESLVKKHGKKKVMDTFARLSKDQTIKVKEEDKGRPWRL